MESGYAVQTGHPRQGLAGERSPPAQQVIYERAQAEASKSERQHGGQKDPFHYVRDCGKTEMKEQCARQRERARHRLSGPRGGGAGVR